MAIHTVHAGKLPAEKWYKGSCTNCKATIIAQEKDGEPYTSTDQRDGSMLLVKCPTSGCALTINSYPIKDTEAQQILRDLPHRGQ